MRVAPVCGLAGKCTARPTEVQMVGWRVLAPKEVWGLYNLSIDPPSCFDGWDGATSGWPLKF